MSKKEKKQTVAKKKATAIAPARKAPVAKKAAKKSNIPDEQIKKPSSKKAPAAKATPKTKPKEERTKLPKKTESTTAAAPKKEKEAKKFFPKGAKPPATPTGAVEPKVASKRTPWMKKPIENPHSTPAGPCVNLKDLFDKYLDKRYKKLKDEQRYQLWKQVSLQMLTEPFSRLEEIIDSHLSRK